MASCWTWIRVGEASVKSDRSCLLWVDTEVGRYEAFVIQIIFQTEENKGPNWIMSHFHYRSKPPKVILPKPMEVDTIPIFFNIFDGLSIE